MTGYFDIYVGGLLACPSGNAPAVEIGDLGNVRFNICQYVLHAGRNITLEISRDIHPRNG